MTAPTPAGEQVRLRPLEEGDVRSYVRAFTDDPQLGVWLGVEDDPSEERVRSFLARPWVDPPDLRAYEWAIADAASDLFLGALMIHSCEWRHRRAEIGFWVVPAERGRGVLAAALRLFLEWSFGEAGLQRIEMTGLPGNEPLVRVANRLGFVFEGISRGRNLERGSRVDELRWGLLAGDRPAPGPTPR